MRKLSQDHNLPRDPCHRRCWSLANRPPSLWHIMANTSAARGWRVYVGTGMCAGARPLVTFGDLWWDALPTAVAAFHGGHLELLLWS